MQEEITIKVADADDEKYVDTILDTIRIAAKSVALVLQNALMGMLPRR